MTLEEYTEYCAQKTAIERDETFDTVCRDLYAKDYRHPVEFLNDLYRISNDSPPGVKRTRANK